MSQNQPGHDHGNNDAQGHRFRAGVEVHVGVAAGRPCTGSVDGKRVPSSSGTSNAPKVKAKTRIDDDSRLGRMWGSVM